MYRLVFTLFAATILLGACRSTKNLSSDSLYGKTWELEYLSGPKIAFEGLFPEKKPQITFDKASGMVTGNNGCNGYSADFSIDGNNLTFGEAGPTTMMYCGEGETHFLKAIEKVNKFNIDDDGKLTLLMDDVPMMRYKAVTQ